MDPIQTFVTPFKERFAGAAASAARPLPADALERFVMLVEHLEDVQLFESWAWTEVRGV